MTDAVPDDPPWLADVVGPARRRPPAGGRVGHPVHAYLLVGPPGRASGRWPGPSPPRCWRPAPAGSATAARHVRLALAEQHPDLRVVEPEGNTFRKRDAERVVRHATLAPIEGARKVIVADGCEDMEDEAAGYLLKTVEEPPASTVFVLLATEVVPELVTIASRCVRVDVFALPPRWSWPTGWWPRASTPSGRHRRGGRRRRPRPGPHPGHRRPPGPAPPGLADVPGGSTAPGTGRPTLVAELQSMIGEALGPLRQRQAAEVAALDEQIEQYGLRGSGQQGPRGPPQARGPPVPHRRAALRAGHPGRRLPGRPGGGPAPPRPGRGHRPGSTPPRWRSSATPTRRCCCRPWWPACRTSSSARAPAVHAGGGGAARTGG